MDCNCDASDSLCYECLGRCAREIGQMRAWDAAAHDAARAWVRPCRVHALRPFDDLLKAQVVSVEEVTAEFDW